MKGRLLSSIVVVMILAAATLRLHPLHADPRIAFLGDSLTEGWKYPRANYGIHGNTTAQMLNRFPSTIADHGYSTVVLLGGTNDVLLGVDRSVTIHNLEEIAEDTEAQRARPVLCTIPPIFHSFNLWDKTDYGPAVIGLNRQIAELAGAHHWKLVDYYTPLSGHLDYSADGVHMKRRGYLVMEMALLRTLYL